MLPKLQLKGIRNRWIVKYLISEYHCIMSRIMPALVSDEKAVKDYYKRITGKELDLVNPETFCEKLNWYKLNHRDPLM